MDQRHAEYVEYYRARAARYAASAIYPEAAAAEQTMLSSISTAPDLETWGADMQQRNLNIACAVALTRDHATAEARLFDSIEEPVRAAGPKRILAEFTSAEGLTAADVASRAAEIYTTNSKEIAIDQLTEVFEGAIDILEEMEIRETAEIPKKWRDDFTRYIEDTYKSGREIWESTVLPNSRRWQEGWDFDESKVWETRFRRRIPIPDDVLKRRLTQYRRYRGQI